jgi:two-component system NtrC family sensor kinase
MFKLYPSIRHKVIFGYYAGIAVIICVSLFTIMELWYIEEKVKFGETVSEIFDTTLEIRRFEKNYFLYEHSEDYQENMRYVMKAQGMLDKNLKDYRKLAVAVQLGSIRNDLKEYRVLMEQFVTTDTHNIHRRSELEKAIREKGKEIITIAEDVSKVERERLRVLLDKIQKFLFISIAAFSLLGIIIGQILSRMVVKPLKSLEERMRLISEGKLEKVSINSKDREIVSLTNAFNKMLKELELRQKHLVQNEKLASLGTLLSGVAHELNNPLSNISSSCQILLEELAEASPEYKKELLVQIDEQTDRAKNIVRSLLDFSRDKKFKKDRLPLKNLFEETILFIKGEIPTKIETVLNIPDDIIIFADKQRIQQAFLNLIKNAVESVPEEGKIFIKAWKQMYTLETSDESEACLHKRYRGKCTGNCPAEEDTIDIEISDTGEGIPPEVLPRIFDPFFTTKDVGKGSGLGLFIVHEIIEEHGGCIGVDSEIGKGTSFLIRLPVKEG